MKREPARPLLDARPLVTGLAFPEGPRWHAGRLYFSDIHGHRIFRLEPDGRSRALAELADRVAGLGVLPDGRLLAVSMLDRRLVSIDVRGRGGVGEPAVHAELAALSGQFINDMVVDGVGRAYVGSRNAGAPGSRSDCLIRVEPDGRAAVEVTELASPNGAVITPDGRSLVLAETADGRLLRFPIRADGSLGRREIVFEAPGLHLDGICLDAAGGIWAGGGVHGLLRITPDFVLDAVFEAPGRMVLATALGGPDGRTLFLATVGRVLLENLAKVGFDRTLDATVDSEGRIETLEVAIPAAAQAPR
ncbi:MAG: SMP-30/gluconolactonase/LRE family protein [Myxococcota bacterium]